ncbi:hypothetical protein GGR58DRAFT_453877 [Xylaria digitata]|nr:hypothetical protein GGR58DRAFT_453877 [Xylaria digitata]
MPILLCGILLFDLVQSCMEYYVCDGWLLAGRAEQTYEAELIRESLHARYRNPHTGYASSMTVPGWGGRVDRE